MLPETINLTIDSNLWYTSIPQKCNHCVIANAIRKQFPDSVISVSCDYIFIGDERYKPDEIIQDIIFCFDAKLNYYQLGNKSGVIKKC